MRSAVAWSSAVVVLLLAPVAHAATPVVVGSPELLVEESVELETPGIGKDFITWVDQRAVGGAPNNNVYLQFQPEHETFALTQSFDPESGQSASGPWVVYTRMVSPEPKAGQARPKPTLDLIVYNVDDKKEVHTSATTDRNELMLRVNGDRVAYAVELISGDTSSPQRVEIMDLKGGNAFKPRVLRETERRQVNPALGTHHVVFLEQEGSEVEVLSHDLRTGQSSTVAPRDPKLGYGSLHVSGTRLLYAVYDRVDETSTAVWYDLEAKRELGRWTASARDTFLNFAHRDDLMVAEVAREAEAGSDATREDKRYLLAWCGADGTPSMFQDAFIQEAEFPALTHWGTLVYLTPQRGAAVYVYQRGIGCGSLPKADSGPGFLPGIDASLLLVAALALPRLLRGRP